MNQVADMMLVYRFPYPWPPQDRYLVLASEANGLPFELIALIDGRLEVKTPNPLTCFVSQPIEFTSDRPTWALVQVTLENTKTTVRISGTTLLGDGPSIPRLVLSSAQGIVPEELSVEHPDIFTICDPWIQNRRSKFSTPITPRTGRRAKSIAEQGHDLVAAIHRLRYLSQQVRAGHLYLLGTLAGEMRAVVFWPKGRDAVPDRNWNPLLLRMASVADLPLPVYAIPDIPKPAVLEEAIVHFEPSKAPRIAKMFNSDHLFDLQDSLQSIVLRLDPEPGRTVSGLDLIKELAHTMGAAHYDEDTSSFVDVMRNMKSQTGDEVTSFMCDTSDTLASLCEWVLSQLRTRNFIP